MMLQMAKKIAEGLGKELVIVKTGMGRLSTSTSIRKN